MTGLEPVEIRYRRFDATGADDEVRFFLQNLERREPFFRFPRQLEVQDDSVSSRQPFDAPPEFVKGVNRDFAAIG
jgi:hypothetical protein